jgi:ribonucleotide reductase alpha subunit
VRNKIHHILKFAILLSKYFYTKKHLSLPGIGVFHLDAAVTVPEFSDKNFREVLKYIQFTHKNVAKADDELIEFIRTQTGKIRPLAESDLESYLADGKLLLNIGKPFTIEGIGSLQKMKSGDLVFSPGEPTIERLDFHTEDKHPDKSVRNIPVYEENQSRTTSHNNQRRVLLVGTLVVIGLIVILWGGYTLYNKSNNEPTQVSSEVNTPITSADTSTIQQSDSSLVQPPPVTAAPSGTYKFIFEQTNRKARALKRFAYVHDLSPRIQMETADSLSFTIFVRLPATPTDTGRLKDSLNAWYYGTKPVKIRIEP